MKKSIHDTYDVTWSNVRIKMNHIIDLQNLVREYPSLRLLHNPKPDRKGFFTISIGGEGPDISAFQKELYQIGWFWEDHKPKKKSFLKRIFG